ncbi:MAG TPA: TonB family protein [Verrucomicrobiae bacterium]|jgi:TonB family protein|nr:TonB family protein [Verrucomicrobiae bacterium]
MSPLPRPGPDSLHQLGSESVTPANPAPETDVAELAARFREKSGGNLTPEMAAELALEVVLNEIVEQACRATNATGAAIALMRGGEMVCRASSGSTAPDLGLRLDTASGLTGECCITRETQRCADALADARVDIEASARLGVRSVIVMPLLRGRELAGIFELLSCWPSVFSEREERILEELAKRTILALERTEQAARPRVEVRTESRPAVRRETSQDGDHPQEPLAAGLQEKAEEKREKVSGEAFPPTPLSITHVEESQLANFGVPVIVRRGGFDLLSFALGAAVLACTALLGVGLGRRFEARRVAAKTVAVQTQSAETVPRQAAQTQQQPAAADPNAASGSSATTAPAANARSNSSAVPPGGLVVFQGGKEVFRLPPNSSGPAAAKETTSGDLVVSSTEVLQVSPADAQALLVHRVEPDYPSEARLKRVQGTVVLGIKVGTDGRVEDLQYLGGPPALAPAAVNAVKQWKFKPQSVNGIPAEMQTTVALLFRLHD